MLGPMSLIDSFLSSICALSNRESMPWRGMLASMDPSREREIPVATSGETDSYCRDKSEASTFPKPSNISLYASLRPSQSEIPISFTTLGGGKWICLFRESVYA